MTKKRTRKTAAKANGKRKGGRKPAAATRTKPDAMVRMKEAVARFHEAHDGKDDCGDAIANRLRAMKTKEGAVDLAALKKLAERNGVWNDRYADLNPGMARMNVGNRLRAMAKRKEAVKW